MFESKTSGPQDHSLQLALYERMKPMSKSAVVRAIAAEQDAPVIDLPLVSTYGPDVKIASLATVDLSDDTPLYSFEERQLKTLIQQVEATPPRIRQAFFAHFNAK